MNIKRVWRLIKTEVFHGPKDVVLVMAIVMPILLALFFNLAFGNIFTDIAKLGIYDEGDSQLTSVLKTNESIRLKTYENKTDLINATASGSVDMGVVLPSDFDDTVESGTVKLDAYIWGESLAMNRTIIPIALTDAIREIKGAILPVNINTVPLGDEASLPWNDRLLPTVVLLAIFFGGMMIPASSLINEKNRHTLEALSVTPTTITDIFVAKGIIGASLAIVMGVITLSISGAFNSSFGSLVLVLALGAVMAAEIGLIVGAYIKEMNNLFAFWKFGGLLLFGPAIVFMFPEIPQWISYIFPTYYIIRPVTDLTINGLGFSSIIPHLGILIVIIIAIALIVRNIISRLSTKALKLYS
ncbi:MAG: ABC transporter permease [Dehalococcoidales bacterium]|nr:ABC transporter permease [Dehalococcoidales bacterium]